MSAASSSMFVKRQRPDDDSSLPALSNPLGIKRDPPVSSSSKEESTDALADLQKRMESAYIQQKRGPKVDLARRDPEGRALLDMKTETCQVCETTMLAENFTHAIKKGGKFDAKISDKICNHCFRDGAKVPKNTPRPQAQVMAQALAPPMYQNPFIGQQSPRFGRRGGR